MCDFSGREHFCPHPFYFLRPKYWLVDHLFLCLLRVSHFFVLSRPHYEDRVVFMLGLYDRYQVRLFVLNLQRNLTSGFVEVVELLFKLKLLKVAIFHIHG